MKRILIADDDASIRMLLAESLEEEGFEVVEAANGKAVLAVIENGPPPDLVLLDIMMPEMNGLDVCRAIRSTYAAPIIFMTAKAGELDKIIGLELGGDDYITKPFSLHEVVARVKAHLRREARRPVTETLVIQETEAMFTFGDVAVNPATYEVYLKGSPISLTTLEITILQYFYSNQNRVLSRAQIYDAVWGIGDDYADLNTVTVHVKNLRRKIDEKHRHIITVWGAGYKFTC
jgi:DNA-binding response OmpR family regulator